MERLAEQLWGGHTAETAVAEPGRMPAFAAATEAHHHSVHSALAALEALRVPAERITVKRTGREAVAAGTVVRQHPPAGTPLLPGTAVELFVAGLGFHHALPVGLWDSGGETHAGTREVLEGLDDPLEKLGHWVHEGAPLFRLSPDDPRACQRWLALFGVEAERWPQRLWYRLAVLIAGMSEFSCSEAGTAFVLETLLGLPVKRFSYLPTFTALPRESVSSLGARASRLGVDLLVGNAVEDLATLEIELGPVPLAVFEFFDEAAEGRTLLRQTLDLLLPVSGDSTIRWAVLDASRAPRLGMRESNSRLGVNTHMGDEAATVLQDAPLPVMAPRSAATEPLSAGATR